MNILLYVLGWMENIIRCLFLFYLIILKLEFNYIWFVMNMFIRESKWLVNFCVWGFYLELLIFLVGDKLYCGLILF